MRGAHNRKNQSYRYIYVCVLRNSKGKGILKWNKNVEDIQGRDPKIKLLIKLKL